MSQPVAVEQALGPCLAMPLRRGAESTPQVAEEGLRPDVGLTLVLVPVTVLLCCAWGVRPNLDVQPFGYAMTALVLIALVPAFFLFMVASVLGLRRDVPGLTRLSTAGFLRNCAVLTAMSWVYSHLKAGVLLGTSCDLLLLDCDRVLLGGNDAWALCRSAVPDCMAPLLSSVYLMFMPVILGSIFWLTLTGQVRLADRLTCSIVLAYYVGGFAYHLLPSYGPAYAFGDARPEGLSLSITLLQELILEGTQSVQQDPLGAVILPWRYIAAFPSLHCSHVLILTWYLRHNRLTLTVAGVYSFLTAVATLYFGWHYLTDLFGGLAVAVLVLWLTAPRESGGRQAESGIRLLARHRWRRSGGSRQARHPA